MSCPVVQVATVGKSSGSTTLSSLLACAAVDYGVRPLLIELDPSGGDLIGRLPRRDWRRVSSFYEQVSASELLPGQIDLGEFVVESFAGGPGLVVGDPHSDGIDQRFGDGEFGNWLPGGGWDCVVVDSGRLSASSIRQDCSLLYLCVDVVNAPDLDRAKRGCELARSVLSPESEMVVIVRESRWRENEIRDYLENVENWRLTNVGPNRSVRKCWSWFREGDWLAGREAKGFVRLRQFATPIAGVVEQYKSSVESSSGSALPEVEDLVGGSGLPLDWTSPDEVGVWDDFVGS